MSRFPKLINDAVCLFRFFFRRLEKEVVEAQKLKAGGYTLPARVVKTTEDVGRMERSVVNLPPGEFPTVSRLEEAGRHAQRAYGHLLSDQKRFLSSRETLPVLRGRVNELFGSSSQTIWIRGRQLKERLEAYKSLSSTAVSMAELRSAFVSLVGDIASAEAMAQAKKAEEIAEKIRKTLAPPPAKARKGKKSRRRQVEQATV